MQIRSYQPKDASALANLFVRSVDQIGRRDYSPLQIEAWIAHAPSPKRLQALSEDGRTRLVAVVDDTDQPVAFVDLEHNGHIDLFYCAPEVAGSGVAAALYEEAERVAREQGVSRLFTEASEAGRRFFLRKEFVVTGQRDFELSGVMMRNYAMRKQLSPGIGHAGSP